MFKFSLQQKNESVSKSWKQKLSKYKPTSTRTKIGWIAVTLILLLAFGILRYYTIGDDSFFEMNRLCILMILLWIAWPELVRLPHWLMCVVPVCVAVCAWRPQYIIAVIPLAFFYLLLRPPAKRYKKNKK